jgi:hypothetical protein
MKKGEHGEGDSLSMENKLRLNRLGLKKEDRVAKVRTSMSNHKMPWSNI